MNSSGKLLVFSGRFKLSSWQFYPSPFAMRVNSPIFFISSNESFPGYVVIGNVIGDVCVLQNFRSFAGQKRSELLEPGCL